MKLRFVAAVVVSATALSFGQNPAPATSTASSVRPSQTTNGDVQGPATAADSAYVPVHKFDPKRDATADIQAAIVEAQRTGKRIILDVGGDWCGYCHQMDQFFQEQREILQVREANFVTVAIYYGADKKTQPALSHYSKVLGIPHFFVLEKDGRLLYSQHVLELRTGGKYDPEKMKAFLLKWSPAASASAAKVN